VTLQATFAATLVDEWVRAGVTTAVVAPGSRSTPLALALIERMEVQVFLDERSAGFFALGRALSSGKPAVVLTTSGSAAGHLLPAVMEAHHSCVPLLVCTADRPPVLHDVGAPQTTMQAGLYGGFTRWAASVSCTLPAAAWRSVAARAFVEAQSGPVHLNLMFDEPLVGSPSALPPGRENGAPWHVGAGASFAAVPSLPEFSGKSGVIVATVPSTDALELGARLGWPVLAGPTSGCRGPSRGAVVVSAFDAILRDPSTAARLTPEVIVRVGDNPASKVATSWMSASSAVEIVVDPFGRWLDPSRAASMVVAANVSALLDVIGSATPAPSGWAAAWGEAEIGAQQAIEGVLAGQASITEPALARRLTSVLEADATLLVASSMPIRDVEWYGDPAMACRVVANRGLNGIDGMVSTALGVGGVALMGDLAFLHDVGGLLGSGARGLDCTMVVVDNDGGGIFSFLPQRSLPGDVFERLFGTPHGLDLSAVARSFGVSAVSVSSLAELADAVGQRGGVRVVVAHSDRERNVAVHDELVAAVAAALG
jgi:2-succinyl-5-enolpyruvyl-6-hydroxy-3-cyclohexene-1-carboxylate synthase